jgi:hypothetical protein
MILCQASRPGRLSEERIAPTARVFSVVLPGHGSSSGVVPNPYTEVPWLDSAAPAPHGLIDIRLAREGRLCGGLPRRRLQLVEIVRGALRMAGGGEDRTAVMLEDFE